MQTGRLKIYRFLFKLESKSQDDANGAICAKVCGEDLLLIKESIWRLGSSFIPGAGVFGILICDDFGEID